jgi:hypothetical protein
MAEMRVLTFRGLLHFNFITEDVGKILENIIIQWLQRFELLDSWPNAFNFYENFQKKIQGHLVRINMEGSLKLIIVRLNSK